MVTCTGAIKSDKVSGHSQADALGLLEVVRLVWACLVGLLIVVKVKIDNKGAGPLEAITCSNYSLY